MSGHKYNEDRRRHEDEGGNQRAPGKPCQSADAMPAGAAATVNGAKANEQTGECGERKIGGDGLLDASSGRSSPDKRSNNEPDDEGQRLKRSAVRKRHHQSAHNAAYAGNPSAEKHE